MGGQARPLPLGTGVSGRVPWLAAAALASSRGQSPQPLDPSRPGGLSFPGLPSAGPTPRRASCRKVIEAHMRRIEDVNPAVNAVTVVLADQALHAAEAADQAAGGGDLPPGSASSRRSTPDSRMRATTPRATSRQAPALLRGCAGRDRRP